MRDILFIGNIDQQMITGIIPLPPLPLRKVKALKMHRDLKKQSVEHILDFFKPYFFVN